MKHLHKYNENETHPGELGFGLESSLVTVYYAFYLSEDSYTIGEWFLNEEDAEKFLGDTNAVGDVIEIFTYVGSDNQKMADQWEEKRKRWKQ